MRSFFALGSILSAFGLLALVGCPQESKVPHNADAGQGDTSACGSSCEHLRKLGCDLAKDTPRGKKCEEWCKVILEENGGLGWPTKCFLDASICQEADKCR